ncbi:AMIN domain-containing protein [Leptolyngbya sp. NIES-2104]|uniref:AMIN domain-containing protein n=1 Tax=Leptolyngbya sp. NIES-2104 TaxID=1552121 RepID=UPI0006ECA3A1|nr:AMIN domain-containing protein [Leptolyngbya sp. NIES-2104]GAP97873.1 N-acetylmuramoyl-L-alanine amidase [Leptolyngbya sp. NIES-2104]
MLNAHKLELTVSIALLLAAPATAAPLENWRFDPNTNQLEVTVPAGIKPRYTLLAQPTRIVLDLPETQIGAVAPRGSYSGAVREIRVSQFQPNVARIVIELAPNAVLDRQQAQLQQVQDSDQTSDRWILRPLLAASAPSPTTQAVFNQLRPIQTAPVQAPQVAQTQTNSANDFGLPPAPPTIEATPSTPVAVPPPTESRPLPTAPAVMPPLQPAPLPAAGSGNSPGSSLLFPDAVRPATPSNPLQLPEVNPSLAIPNSFPPINAPTAQPTVTVPPLDRSSTPSQPTEPRSIPAEPRTTAQPIENTPVPARARTIQFGQPLPTLTN